jgi:nicotinamide-nucleotide amidase
VILWKGDYFPGLDEGVLRSRSLIPSTRSTGGVLGEGLRMLGLGGREEPEVVKMLRMTAEIVSVGTELLLGQIADTDAQFMGRLLAGLGITHRHRQTVGDNLERLTETLRLALSRSDIVITIGGLGPTEDDITREGIAAALGEELVRDEEIAERLRKLFAMRKLPWVESQNKQAMRPSCAEAIDNPNGTAPGLVCRKNGKIVIAMPGPRGEFVPMAEGPVQDLLKEISGGEIIHSKTLKVAGLGESSVEDRVRDLLHSQNPTLAPYAHVGEVHLRLTARAKSREEAEELMQPAEREVRERLGEHFFGFDEDTLEGDVLSRLKARDEDVAVAESCTGGLLGKRFTSVVGAGDSFKGGVISYQEEIKHKVLGVSEKTLETKCAVSPECAEEMAEGIKNLMDATYGVSITGLAGPNSDSSGKPVGLVYVGVAGPDGVQVEEFHFRGQRDDIRQRAAQSALFLLRKRLLERE